MSRYCSEGGLKPKHRIGDLPLCPTDIFHSKHELYNTHLFFKDEFKHENQTSCSLEIFL